MLEWFVVRPPIPASAAPAPAPTAAAVKMPKKFSRGGQQQDTRGLKAKAQKAAAAQQKQRAHAAAKDKVVSE